MNDLAERRRATQSVIEWISESLGDEVASNWAWGATPIPCGLPSDKQLDEGLRVATGELSIGSLLGQVEQETSEQMDAYMASQAPPLAPSAIPKEKP